MQKTKVRTSQTCTSNSGENTGKQKKQMKNRSYRKQAGKSVLAYETASFSAQGEMVSNITKIYIFRVTAHFHNC